MSALANIMHNKPLLIGGGIVVVGIVLVFATSGNSGVSTTQAPAGQSDTQIAAARDIQVASIQAAGAASQTNAQLALAQLQGDSALAQAGLAAKLAMYQTDADTASTNQQYTLQAELARMQIEASTHQSDVLTQTQSAIAKYTLDQAYATQVNNNEFQLSYAEQAGQTSVMMQQIQASVTNNVLTSQYDQQALDTAARRDVALAGYQLQGVETAASRDVALAQIQGDYDLAYATINANKVNQDTIIAALPSVKAKNRDDVLQALITGQPYYAQTGPSKTAQVIGSVGSAAGNIAKLAAFF